MTDEAQIKKILKMSPHELLVFVLTWPGYYYSKFKYAVYTRAKELNLYE